jgi:putative spermidine/putrescine transport system substrate-binding protein
VKSLDHSLAARPFRPFHRSAVAIALTLAGMSSTPAFAETTLYVAGVGGSTEQMYKNRVIPAFEKQHNVKVVYVAGNSTETLAKLQAQKGRQQINVAMMDDGPMYQALQMGLCEKLTDAPIYKDLYPLARLSPEATGAVGPPRIPGKTSPTRASSNCSACRR